MLVLFASASRLWLEFHDSTASLKPCLAGAKNNRPYLDAGHRSEDIYLRIDSVLEPCFHAMKRGFKVQAKRKNKMRTQTYYHYAPYRPSPFALFGIILLIIAGFFIMLPIFLAAFTVFAAFAGYLSWKVNKSMKDFERRYYMNRDCTVGLTDKDSVIIDISPNTGDEAPADNYL